MTGRCPTSRFVTRKVESGPRPPASPRGLPVRRYLTLLIAWPLFAPDAPDVDPALESQHRPGQERCAGGRLHMTGRLRGCTRGSRGARVGRVG